LREVPLQCDKKQEDRYDDHDRACQQQPVFDAVLADGLV
jgi:hypothetical protein